MMQEETQEMCCPGWYVPSPIVKKFASREINCEELVLLSLIDSLSSHEDPATFSDSKIANRMNITSRQATNLVADLIAKNLLVAGFDSDNDRTLYSRLSSSKCV